MRISKAIPTLVLVFVAIALANSALMFAVGTYGSKSELVWTDYPAQVEMDTVMVGTSLMQYAVNPYLLDEACGFCSYCLATPSQTLEESLIGIQTAYEDHGIRRAIIGVSLSNLQSERATSLGGAFLYQRGRVVSLAQAVDAAGQVLVRYGGMGDPDSLNALCPWAYNNVSPTPSSIVDNVRARLTRSVYEQSEITDPDWKYIGKGFGTCKEVLDYDSRKVEPLFSGSYVDDDGAPVTEIDGSCLRVLADMAAYCDDKGIDLVAVALPMPEYNVVDGDGYYAFHDNMVRAFEDLGCDFYDFSFARPELFENEPDYYFDTMHMNKKGSDAFTGSLARLLSRRAAGEDVLASFYDCDEQNASVDRISAVFADTAVDEAGIHVTARVAAGAGVEAEYRLLVYGERGDSWDAVGDWSGEPSFDYAPGGYGVIKLRVCARKAGSHDEYDRYCTLKAFY